MKRILISWLRRTDLRAVTDSDQIGIGPTAQALGTGRFSRLELLCDYISDEADCLTFHLSPRTPAMAAVWIILAKTRFPAELIGSSIQHGVEQ